MYTQVTFGDYLGRVLENIKRSRAVEFDEYPNIASSWTDGDWLYEIRNDFSVRIFRWLRESEVIIAGPYREIPPSENQADFETRFESEFNAAVDQLSDNL